MPSSGTQHAVETGHRPFRQGWVAGAALARARVPTGGAQFGIRFAFGV
jgi:hypothetical protein